MSAKRGPRGSGMRRDLLLPIRVSMPKRNLRIVKRVANIPVLAICEYCNEQFSGNPKGMTIEGQPAIQEQFDTHQCEGLDESRNVLRGVKEAIEGWARRRIAA